MMGRKYVFRDSQELYFIGFATVNWIDVFVRREYFDNVANSIKYCIENKGLELYAWCIMSSHVHMIISSEKENLSNIIRDLKRHTTKALVKAISENNNESRREWMLWIACPDFYRDPEGQVLETPTTKLTNFGSKTTIRLRYPQQIC